MSDRRYTAILGAAVLTAGVATFSVYRILRAAAEPRREATVAVVVLAEDVPAGVPVPREALSQVAWPARVAPDGALASVDSVAGRVARVALTRGEPVRATSLAPQGAAPGLEGTITADHRAIAVRVNEAAGVSGLMRPDSRVDVLVTSRGDNGANGTATTARLVMADVRVLGVGPARPDEAKAGDKEPMPANVASIVTLEVTPAQAALVAAAEQEGTIQVVLRGFGSQSAAAGPPGNVADTLVPYVPGVAAPAAPGMAGRPTGTPAAPPTPAPKATVAARTPRPAPRPVAAAPAPAAGPDSVTIQVYRGGQLTLLRVEATRAAAVTPPTTPALHTAALGQR